MLTKSNTPMLFLLAVALSLQAQTTDPLWLQAQSQIQSTRNLVAVEVSIHTEVLDGDGKNQLTVDKKTRLTGWKDGEPLRSVVSLTESQKSALGNAPLDAGVSNHPDRGFADFLTVQRQEETVLDSKSCVLFQVTGKKKKISFTGKVWIEKATGLPLRVDCTYDPSSIPMTKAMSTSISYGRSGDGPWMPKVMILDSLMSVMFTKVRTTVRQDFDAWITRP